MYVRNTYTHISKQTEETNAEYVFHNKLGNMSNVQTNTNKSTSEKKLNLN